MWNGFVGQTIASTSRTQFTISKLFIVVTLGIVLYSSRTTINLANGAQHFDEARLAAFSNTAYNIRDYATVEGRDTDNTGVQAIQQLTRNDVVESRTVTAQYMLMLVGKHLLVVKAKPNDKATKYTGKLVALPADVKEPIFSGLPDSTILEAATFPAMLDASKNYADDDFWAGLSVAVLSAIFAMWLFYLFKKRSASPETHPLAKAISKYGPIYTLVPQIDAEVSAGSAYVLGVRMTDNWLISCTVTNSAVMRRDEVVWAYKKRTKRSINFIPAGTSYSSVLRDSRGKAFEISASNEQQAEGFLNGITTRTPWIVVGYDNKIEKLYRKNVAEFSAMVAQKKAALTSRA